MIQQLINIVFALIGIALYVVAPERYDVDFCMVVLGVYIVHNACWLIFLRRKDWFGFEVLFMISFLFVNFIYPVVYAPDNPHWTFFGRSFNRHIICQATALAYMAYTFYLIGITSWKKGGTKDVEKPSIMQDVLPYCRGLVIIVVICWGAFWGLGGLSALDKVYGGGGNIKDVGIYSYFSNIFSIAVMLLAIFWYGLDRKRRVVYLGILAVMMGMLLSTGSRSLAVSVVLILMVSYSLHIKHLKAWQVGGLILVGGCVLYALMMIRGAKSDYVSWGELLHQHKTSVLDVFSDLTINNFSLYILIEWGNNHPLTWLQGMLIDICSPIPTLGSKIVEYMGVAPELLNGGDLPSYLVLGRNAGWGIGTNMVGEAYRSFGLVGMCIVMWGIGRFILWSYVQSSHNIYCYAVYMLMVGHAVIYPRSPILYDPRIIVWGLLLIWGISVVIKILERKRQKADDRKQDRSIKKVVYCIPGLWNAGGMERVLCQKVNWIAEHTDWEVSIITTEVVPEGKKRNYFPLDERVKVVEMGVDFNADYYKALPIKWWNHIRKQHVYRKQLEELLRREGERAKGREGEKVVCISLCGKEIEWLGKAKVVCKKIAELHFAMDYRAQLFCQYHPGWMGRCIGRFLTHQLVENMQQMDQLVVLTEVDRWAWEKAGVKHVVCIPNPSALEPSNKGKHNKKQLLAVGRLHPQKGFDLLLEAWSQLAPKHPDWILRIAGEGDSRKALEQQIRDLGLSESVSMEGVSQDICANYQSSRLFVLPSRWEGLPLALIEAMSLGTCCVAFDCPQGPSELIQDGITGRLVSNGDIPALVQALSEQMDDAEGSSQMGEAAYRYVQEHFALEPIMTKWKELLLLPH